MKPSEIKSLIDFISKSGLNEVKIETEEFKISVVREPEQPTRVVETVAAAAAAPAAAPAPVVSQVPASTPAPAAAPAAETNANLVTIKAPMIGTFYKSANPESPAFANVGDKISAGQTVCIIEAMKLFNEIESEVSGTIVEILVDDATPVEFDTPLFLVDPTK
ncbi:acetyl-CoA carboxylase biotin carboxyl carrier protein [Persicobacter psychrovividus]|uniref:Biotin carboxyl carrier protein of acetyl-CoA carboxylase n=1 Tax=Persicobacter psychrovividus TaxID=387638 RepID=A0ABN6L604_9BACT|nr:acetyl-CoA carboxylase, biotin carboxyl carrier protein [Persicobacter psychrovividus]